MRRFGGIEEEFTGYDRSEVLLQSIPYDGTSTWGKGADKGFDAFLEAAENMELYDIETGTEAYRKGIHILPEISEAGSPEAVYLEVKKQVRRLLESGKLLTFFGGEHAISIGIIEEYINKYPGITILQLDAHADLRPEYLGSPYNHACAVHAASKRANLIQVGIRSMDFGELEFMDREKCFTAEGMQSDPEWMDKSLALMTDEVYITLDLDVFDPSVMPDTGTPEPGGILWYGMIAYLRRVFSEKQVKGFDIVEYSPVTNQKAPGFLVAKLYYKMLSYYFSYGEKG